MPLRAHLTATAFAATFMATHANAGICAIAEKPLGMLQFVIDQMPDDNHNTEIRADFDGDGKEDQLRWSPQESGSTLPADYASVTLKLASSEQQFVLEETYVNVLKYERRYYIVTASLEHDAVPSKASVFALGRSGFRRLCSFTSRRTPKR